jgi:lysophospholipase L1-like esterase
MRRVASEDRARRSMRLRRATALGLVCLLAVACSTVPEAPEGLQVRDGLGNVGQKLRDGEDVRVAYLGGSITEANGWRPLTTRWLRDRADGEARVEETNAALGGTGSRLGLFRLERDVLSHRPDLVFVEFAVNDIKAGPRIVQAAMEGIVRQVWRANPRADVVFVYAYARELGPDLRAGREPIAIAASETVAERYGVPSIHVAREVQERLRDGSVTLQAYVGDSTEDGEKAVVLTRDGTHPTDDGHRFYADVVAKAFPALLAADPVDHAKRLAGERLAEEDLDRVRWISADELTRTGDWQPRPRDRRKFGAVWEATTPGSSIEARVRGVRSAELLLLLERGGGGFFDVEVDGVKSRAEVKKIIPAVGVGAGPFVKLVRVAGGLDPDVEHVLRFALPTTDDPRAMRRMSVAALLVVEDASAGAPPRSDDEASERTG